MLKKKPVKKPTERDEKELNDSIAELSRQTAALLGSDDSEASIKKTTMTKSSSPKKSSVPVKAKKTKVESQSSSKNKASAKKSKPKTKPKTTVSTNKSFDIIRPAKSTSVKAKLKTSDQDESKTTRQDLPEQDSAPTEPAFDPTPPQESSQIVVKSHKKGGLAIASNVDSPDQNEAQDNTKNSVEVSHVSVESPKGLGVKASSATAIKFSEDPDEQPEQDEPQTDFSVESEETQEDKLPKMDNLDLLDEPDTEDIIKDDSTEETSISPNETDGSPAPTGEIYANNLVKESKKERGYTPADGQQKPTVFDTNQYHVELHDWSKLGSNNSLKFIGFLILLAMVGFLIYLAMFNSDLAKQLLDKTQSLL